MVAAHGFLLIGERSPEWFSFPLQVAGDLSEEVRLVSLIDLTVLKSWFIMGF